MVEREAVEEGAAQLGDPARLDGVRGKTEPPGELSPVRGEHGRAAVAIEVGTLGIDEDRNAPVPAPGDGVPEDRGRETSLRVVAQDERVGTRRPGESVEQGPGVSRREGIGLLPVQPQHLVPPGDDAKLPRGRAVGRADDEIGADARVRAERHQLLPRRVDSHHRCEVGDGAEGGDVQRDVRGASRANGRAGDADDRNGSLRADPIRVPLDVLVEHGVAHDQDAKTGQPLDQGRSTVLTANPGGRGRHGAHPSWRIPP